MLNETTQINYEWRALKPGDLKMLLQKMGFQGNG